MFLGAGVHADDSAYTFSLNGSPINPQRFSLSGGTSSIAPGSVICVDTGWFGYGDLFMTLGAERECRFVTTPAQTGGVTSDASGSGTPENGMRLFLELPDGRRTVVGAVVTRIFHRRDVNANEAAQAKDETSKTRPSFDEILVNPLDTMSAEEIHELWGIYLDRWPDGIEKKLAYVNADRVCIAVSGYAGVGDKTRHLGGRSFPPIPPNIRYLIVTESMSPGLSDFSRLSEFRNVVFLIFESMSREPLDAGLISQNISMQYLDISGCRIENYQKLASLTKLHYLNIAGCRNIGDIDFVKGMHQIRSLLMDRTKVSSLSPLDNSNSIREIHAGMTDVRALPEGELPSLQTVNVVSSRLDTQTVEQFRKAHPDVAVHHAWADSLRRAVQGTTRLRIRTGGTCHRQISEEKTLAEITEPTEIEKLLKGLDIDEAGSGGYCRCCGDPTLEFYAGDRLLAMVGYHHGERLRWAGGQWAGDAELTDRSLAFVISWLAQHGVEGPRQVREEQRKRQAEEERIENRYFELIPEQTLASVSEAQSSTGISWNDDPRGEKRRKLVAEAFQKHEKDAVTSAELYMRILGVRADDPWEVYYEYDSVAVHNLLPRFKGPELAQAVIRASKDDEGTKGAARWLLGANGWRNLIDSDRERIVSPLAKRSLEHRQPSARKKTMVALTQMKTEWATALLRPVLSRPPEPQPDPRRAGPGWRIDFGDGTALSSGEYSDPAWAAFCLAKLGDLQSLPVIERLAKDSQGKDKELLSEALHVFRDKER